MLVVHASTLNKTYLFIIYLFIMIWSWKLLTAISLRTIL